MNKIDYLIVSSTYDYSTDLICYKLAKRNVHYYRLNRDELNKHEIILDIKNRNLYLKIDGIENVANFDSLKGVYFRAPVFLRTQSKAFLSLDEQLERSQWSAFIRNLIVFHNAIWINHPVNVYRAENKIFQLFMADRVGLKIPATLLTNTKPDMLKNKDYIVKALDTALFYDFKNNKEMFTYSNVLSGRELNKSDFIKAPVIIQNFLNQKIDCRITYIDGKMFPVKILLNQKGLYGDWRCQKENLVYETFSLPESIKMKLISLMKCLELKFGGIDMAIYEGNYYFIEVNPTGEWGWLETVAHLEISDAICDALMKQKW